jgi:hypothetical protein
MSAGMSSRSGAAPFFHIILALLLPPSCSLNTRLTLDALTLDELTGRRKSAASCWSRDWSLSREIRYVDLLFLLVEIVVLTIITHSHPSPFDNDQVKTLPPYPDAEVVIPEGHGWLEGDAPFNSEDSNHFGPVCIVYSLG